MGLRTYAVRALKRMLPRSLVRAITYRAETRYAARLPDKGRAAVFESIYKDGIWGGRAEGEDFHSGSGSHEPAIVEPYVAAVSRFLDSLGQRPVVVEIGCGDFFVGSRLIDSCDRYVACDIVGSLIDRNRLRYSHPRLSFQVVDAVKDPLPHGDVLIIRQVLQHLSNADIAQIVGKFAAYRHVLITEHLPSIESFTPNLDKPTGFDTRLKCSSGVVLTAEPFNLKPESSFVICEVPEQVGIVRTVVYTN